MATTTAPVATETVVHFFINTFYGFPLGACDEAGHWTKADAIEGPIAGVTCPECIEWLDQDGADD